MRYNLESTLPINAFSPRGGRSPFARSMTLEGGGGGGIGGVLKPVTNVLGGAAKAVTQGVKGIVQPVYNATLKQIPGVDKALVNLDKSVGKAIPGGWGTVASVASSFIPGSQLALMGMTQTGLATGLGALTGSGVMKKDHQFNLQGAIMGGAMAYGASQLSQGLQEAGKSTTQAIEEAAKAPLDSSTSALTGTGSAPVSGIGSSVTPTANALSNLPADGAMSLPANAPTAAQSFAPAGDYGLKNIATNPIVPSGDFGINPAASATAANQLGTSAPVGMLDKFASSVQNIPSAIVDKATSAFDTLTSPETYSSMGTKLSEAGSGALSNMADAGAGIKNIVTGSASLPANVTMMNTAIPMVMGASGLMALEEQSKYLDQQAASGAISNAEYNAAKAKIDTQIATARSAVSANPLQTSADTSTVTEGPSLYAKKTTGFDTLYDKNPAGGTTLYEQAPVEVASGGMISRYAMGGAVNPLDDQTNMASRTPMTNFDRSGVASMIGNTVPQQMYATGGIAEGRFLSGGGDGMSDSIKANINGNQEARLADGEFVIPADVVSHLGNGSSKAGAKQLYSMMDKVRQARVGTKKQGKQINPRKYLTA